MEEKKISRKDFLKLAGTATVATMAAGLTDIGGTAAVEEKIKDVGVDLSKIPEDIIKRSDLLRMQQDLIGALKKPRKERKWSMVIDLRKCIGCHACTVGCIAENVLPPGVVYRPVLDEETGSYPNVTRRFTPRLCMQCDDPPCVAGCPVKATYKREDGFVEIDYKKCIGCKYCLVTCPYEARDSDHGRLYTQDTPKVMDYELRPNYEYGRRWPRKKGKSPVGNARKCHFCIHRVESGILPACVVTCIGEATYFGDRNDAHALISKLISKPNAVVLMPEYGTKPNVYYLI